jgi:hypothetical protein
MDMHASRKRLPANCYVLLYGSCGSLYEDHAGVEREILYTKKAALKSGPLFITRNAGWLINPA